MAPDKWNLCSCVVLDPDFTARSLPLVQVATHVTVQSTAYKSTLNQTFRNPLRDRTLQRVRYSFPLFDGVSVVAFQCRIGDRIISSVVKERKQARVEFDEAASRGQVAGLLEQSTAASDVFATTLSNIPPESSIQVTISYIGELKHDAGLDALRLVIPTAIAPRYGQTGEALTAAGSSHVFDGVFKREADAVARGGMDITVDVSLSESSSLQKITSPTHPIAVTIGTLSTEPDAASSPSKASASLALQSAELDKDFVLQIAAKDIGAPQAFLENHPDIPGQRAIMATFVPKFALKSQKPEIIFIADRSGSMQEVIPLLQSAMRVFIKSLPTGVYFNICSFGSERELLWKKSQEYSAESMQAALKYIDTFDANFGGTETLGAVKYAVESRRPDLPTELMLLTDGDIWQQGEFFEYINEQVTNSKGDVRLFSLGIGGGVSHSLLEGCARAGRGFSQAVSDGDRLDSKVVRMVKGALTPHINDSRFEVEFEESGSGSTRRKVGNDKADQDDFEMVDSTTDAASGDEIKATTSKAPAPAISLYDPSANLDTSTTTSDDESIEPGDLPEIPEMIFAPCLLPPLFPFSRTTVTVLLASELSKKTPKQIVFRGTSPQGPLELTIPLTRAAPGATFHQMAARKAILELEEGRGWLEEVKDPAGKLLRDTRPTRFEKLLEHEAVRLGTKFQVASKWCSFIAVEASSSDELVAKRQRVLDGAEPADDGDDKARSNFELVDRPSSHQAPFASARAGPAGTKKKMAGPIGTGLFSSMAAPQASFAAMPPPPPQAAPARSGIFGGFGSSALLGKSSGFSSAPFGATSSGGGLFGSSGGSGAAPRAELRSMAARPSRCSAAPQAYEYAFDQDEAQDALDQGEAGCAFMFEEGEEELAENDMELQLDAGGRETSGTSLLDRIIAAQAFDGSWSAEAVPWAKLGLDDDAVAKIKADHDTQTASTAVVVLFLEHKLVEEREVWELVVDKARSWLDERLTGASDGGEAVWSAARQRLGLA